MIKRMMISEKHWSQLPENLLWMIKDRLNFRESFNVSIVCKNWESASLTYNLSKPPPECIVVPWMMHRSTSNSACDFINPVTKEKFTLDLPELQEFQKFLFSRKGRFIFKHNIYNPTFDNPYLILNPRTNAKIIIPQPKEKPFASHASFSTWEDDTPKSIVLAGESNNSSIICIASVDDKRWIVHSHGKQDGSCISGPCTFVVHKEKVYFLDFYGKLTIFDMGNHLWTKVNVNVESGYRNQGIMECGKDVVKIDQSVDTEAYRCYRLNNSETAWEEMNKEEPMCWFLHSPDNKFCVTGNQELKKVYRYCNECEYDRDAATKIDKPTVLFGHPMKYYGTMEVHDLMNGSRDLYRTSSNGYWVDFGWMSELPPSCVSYVTSDNKIGS